jgi:hypothetical protein
MRRRGRGRQVLAEIACQARGVAQIERGSPQATARCEAARPTAASEGSSPRTCARTTQPSAPRFPRRGAGDRSETRPTDPRPSCPSPSGGSSSAPLRLTIESIGGHALPQASSAKFMYPMTNAKLPLRARVNTIAALRGTPASGGRARRRGDIACKQSPERRRRRFAWPPQS